MRLLLSFAAVAAVAAATTAPAGATTNGCAPVALSGTTTLNVATGTVEGTFTGTIGHQPAVVHSVTTILGGEQRGAVMFLATTHTLTLGAAQLRTSDNARLVPTPTPGVFHAVSRLEVVSGGTGFVVGVGEIDFRSGITATWKQIHGRICG